MPRLDIRSGHSGAEGIAKLVSEAEIRRKVERQPGSVFPVAHIVSDAVDAKPVAQVGNPYRVVQTLRIDDWHPVPLNQLMGRHWAKAAKAKKADRQKVEDACKMAGIRPATCRRRLSLLIVWPPKRRAPDPDAFDKSLRDALVHAGALVNDSDNWVEGTPPEYARGRRLVTIITLEDL